MSTTTGKKKANGSSERAVISALGERQDATAAELATQAGLGRSTVSGLLAKLERRGEVKRQPGGRNGARRLPDRWARVQHAAQPSARVADAPSPGEPSEAPGAPGEAGEEQSATAQAGAADRLPRLGLNGLVLDYMREHRDGPLGPGTIAKAIDKSSGAVANCLVRLARDQHVCQVSERPIRYSLASKGSPTAGRPAAT